MCSSSKPAIPEPVQAPEPIEDDNPLDLKIGDERKSVKKRKRVGLSDLRIGPTTAGGATSTGVNLG